MFGRLLKIEMDCSTTFLPSTVVSYLGFAVNLIISLDGWMKLNKTLEMDGVNSMAMIHLVGWINLFLFRMNQILCNCFKSLNSCEYFKTKNVLIIYHFLIIY